MNTRLLKYAVEVERAGSITKAADNLYMSQPNLSKALRELESEFGVTIFNRTTKGIEPTAKGASFLKYAKRVLEQLDEMETLFAPEKSGIVEINLAVPRTRYLSCYFAKYIGGLDPDRGIRATYIETDAQDVIARVSNFSSNIGIVRYAESQEKCLLSQLEENDLKSRPLAEFGYVLIMSEDNPLAQKDRIEKDDLVGYLEISNGIYDTSGMENEPATSRNKRITVYERGGQFDLLRQVRTSYMKEAPVPEELLRQHGLVQKEVENEPERYKDIFIFRNGYRLKTDEENFYALLKDAIEHGCGKKIDIIMSVNGITVTAVRYSFFLSSFEWLSRINYRLQRETGVL